MHAAGLAPLAAPPLARRGRLPVLIRPAIEQRPDDEVVRVQFRHAHPPADAVKDELEPAEITSVTAGVEWKIFLRMANFGAACRTKPRHFPEEVQDPCRGYRTVIVPSGALNGSRYI